MRNDRKFNKILTFFHHILLVLLGHIKKSNDVAIKEKEFYPYEETRLMKLIHTITFRRGGLEAGIALIDAFYQFDLKCEVFLSILEELTTANDVPDANTVYMHFQTYVNVVTNHNIEMFAFAQRKYARFNQRDEHSFGR